MKVSQNCIDLIKKWEGCKLTAYKCPAGVWTIGIGTTCYPDGRRVREGDKITDQQAEGFLVHECEEKAKAVDKLVNVDLHQNQFDALVSFAYNVGIGAFKESTLLRLLNQPNYNEAANQFKEWNKATVNGQRVVLEGLVNRRKDEEELFRKTDGFGEPIDLEPSPQSSATWLKGFLENQNTVVVAYKADQVVEIITLKSPLKEDLIDVLRQYPNAQNFHIAAPNEQIPAGNRVEFEGRTQAISRVANPPTLERGLLLKGMTDNDAGISSKDIAEMQQRLKDLGYYNGEIDGDFGSGTDNAVRRFQADVFGQSQADGKVGTKTWAKLWGEDGVVSTGQGEARKTYLRLTKTNRKDRFGCYVLLLEYIKNGQVKDSLEVCSGQPNRQFFRAGSQSVSGSMEPLPEGQWYINNINWADGKDKYGPVVFNNGLGPVSTPIGYKGPNSTRRSAIEIHIDWNRVTSAGNPNSPGTAGCIGIYNIADYKKFVSWLRENENPELRDLYVNWGLGTCPQPQ
ncbi:MAG: glycoside hydrolase family protein [Microcystis sp. LE19-114.1B]|nr:glycoside hydrolase family protein [Microcystis sp. LE19-114.1B]